MATRIRIDRLLVERGLFESRAKAQAAIAAGRVTADYNNQVSPWTFYTWGTPVLLTSAVRHQVRSNL